MQNNLFSNDILKRFEPTKERKPATNRIYLIQQIADQCGMKWKEIFRLCPEHTEQELQHCLDSGKLAGRMKQVNGKWVEKLPEEVQLSIKIRCLYELKVIRNKIRQAKKDLQQKRV